MNPAFKIGLFTFLCLVPVAAVVTYGVIKTRGSKSSETDGEYKELYWQKLRELNYSTGQMTADLESYMGKKVKVPGFVVPLDDDAHGLSDFLLVPSPKACIHVPPPPPNQMVMVKMKSGTAPKREYGPVWVKGTFRYENSDSGYGKVSFLLYGDSAEPYKAPENPDVQ